MKKRYVWLLLGLLVITLIMNVNSLFYYLPESSQLHVILWWNGHICTIEHSDRVSETIRELSCHNHQQFQVEVLMPCVSDSFIAMQNYSVTDIME